MNEELGLAAQQYGAESGAPSAGSGQPITVEEVAQLLLQGITPEELVAAGVPQGLVQEAMALAKQMSGGAQAPTGSTVGMNSTPMDEHGLAMQSVGGR
jgi:hypothetical protein